MSEQQYVGFRAIDGPVTKENLAYMENLAVALDGNHDPDVLQDAPCPPAWTSSPTRRRRGRAETLWPR